MSGRPRKATNAIAGHRASSEPLKLVRPTEPAPTAPAGLTAATVAIWDRYWRSDISSLVDRDAGLSIVERWIWYVDELGVQQRKFRRKRYVEGSTGQPAASPAWRIVQSLEPMIRNLEEALGMTPLARRRLGYNLGGPGALGGRKRDVLDELNADLDDLGDAGGADYDDDDPAE